MIPTFNKKVIFTCTFTSLYVLYSCIPFCYSNYCEEFKNCTEDTLLIGASYCNDFDSVFFSLYAINNLCDSEKSRSDINLWETSVHSSEIIYPDSLCGIFGNYLFEVDTCYFFLVKYKDAKMYSYDEIRAKKLYGKFVVTKNVNGDFDRNIRYIDK